MRKLFILAVMLMLPLGCNHNSSNSNPSTPSEITSDAKRVPQESSDSDIIPEPKDGCPNPIPLEIAGRTSLNKIGFVDGKPGKMLLKKVLMHMSNTDDGSSATTETVLGGPIPGATSKNLIMNGKNPALLTNRMLCQKVPQKIMRKMYTAFSYDVDRIDGSSKWDANIVFMLNDVNGDSSWVNYTKAAPGSNYAHETMPANVTDLALGNGLKFSQRVYRNSADELEVHVKYSQGNYTMFSVSTYIGSETK